MRKLLAGLIFVLIALVASESSLRAADDCPPIIRSGIWEFKAPGKTSTSLGEFKTNRETGSGRIEGSCKEGTITLFAPTGNLVYKHDPTPVFNNRFTAEPMKFTEGGYSQTFYLAAFVLSPEQFEVEISTKAGTWSGKRKIRYAFAGAEASRRAECDCPEKLDEFIKERIKANEHFIALYGNQDYWKKPPGFPDDIKWEPYAYETLIGFINDRNPYATAVAMVIAQRRNEQPGQEDTTSGSVASMDDETCEVTEGDPDMRFCLAALVEDEDNYHEVKHKERCDRMRNARNEALSNLLAAPPSYAMVMQDISEAAREEVRAYQKSIEWLRN